MVCGSDPGHLFQKRIPNLNQNNDGGHSAGKILDLWGKQRL